MTDSDIKISLEYFISIIEGMGFVTYLIDDHNIKSQFGVTVIEFNEDMYGGRMIYAPYIPLQVTNFQPSFTKMYVHSKTLFTDDDTILKMDSRDKIKPKSFMITPSKTGHTCKTSSEICAGCYNEIRKLIKFRLGE